jgi:TatD DNase family protein
MACEAFWTDSHNHLAMTDFDGDRDEVLARALSSGVRRMLVVGTNPEDWGPAAALAEKSGFRSTAGLHPHEASRWNVGLREALLAASDRAQAAAVGEMGLDYHYDFSPREAQREAFVDQLRIAADRGLPAVVHSREAFEDTFSLLREHAPLRGVMHCFAYGPREAEAFLGLGLHLSFSGIATFPKAPEIRAAAEVTGLDRLLVETDAPYLAPVPYRGKRCEPAHVADVGRFLARHLGIPEEEFARRTSENAARLFGWERVGAVSR